MPTRFAMRVTFRSLVSSRRRERRRVRRLRAVLRVAAGRASAPNVFAFPHTPPGVIGDPLEEGSSYVGQTVLPKGGWTALMYAARQDNIADRTGMTPLYAAVDLHTLQLGFGRPDPPPS